MSRRRDGTERIYDATGAGAGHRVGPSVRAATSVAVVLWCATWVGRDLPRLAQARWWFVAGAGLALCATRRRVVAFACAVVVGAAGGAWAWHGQAPVTIGACGGAALVRTDPVVRGATVTAVLEIDGRRFRTLATGLAGRRLARLLAGERVDVDGTCSPVVGQWAERDLVRHVVGRVDLDRVSEEVSPGSPVARAANRVRRALVGGVAPMPDDLRSLFTGLVIGDDRAQPPAMTDNFREAGLSHLTAVSGQNVAYLLALVSPLTARRGRWSRFAVVVALVAWFALVTRFEPSVSRASVMAVFVALAQTLRRGVNARVVLAATVCALLVVDPMLARSVGFALSVAATAGLAWVSAPLSRRLGLAGGVGAAFTATVAAQVGTAPVLVAVFGSVPVVALVANPLAVTVAGVVMTIGVPVALVGSFVPAVAPATSAALAVPTWWVETVAEICADVGPTGALNGVAWIAVALAVWARARAVGRRGR